MSAEIIDTYDDTTSPALAFIGYIESILTDDIDGMNQFEKTFGRNYMGVGAAAICLVTVSVFERPEFVLLQARQTYAGFTTSPTKRASQRFIEDLLESYAHQEVHEHEHDDDDGHMHSFGIDLTFGRTPRVRYLRALAAVSITLIATLETHSGHSIEAQLIDMRRHFMPSPA
ncbi:hypothetical protein [Aeromicrobium sp. 179-A 4D2 NHS]|uniref:hypothetical protein n=1 Tax=Aeromicrobium sp. 179-A 4D2 NHS TaxID=3142375 RepID=UPI0039A26A1A